MKPFDCWYTENLDFVRATLGRLQGDKYRDEILHDLIPVRHDNIWTTLAHMAKWLRPASYMEIGVRRGYSMAMVAGRVPDCEIWGLDIWVKDYSGVPNPGPEFVREEMKAIGHRGELRFVSGDSKHTLPLITRQFPLILVDGDHSEGMVYQDIQGALRLVEPGGYVVVDDMHNPEVKAAFERATQGHKCEVSGWAGVIYGST